MWQDLRLPYFDKRNFAMKNKLTSVALAAVIITYSLLSLGGVVASAESGTATASESAEDGIRVSSRLLELIFGKREEKRDAVRLVPGGSVFGAKIKQNGVVVTEIGSDGSLFCIGDRIMKINGECVGSLDDAKAKINSSGGGTLDVEVLRAGEKRHIRVTPFLSSGSYKLGVVLKDGAAGIGTVTYIDPETGAFGGLGHGICDAETGEVIEMTEGVVSGVLLGGVERGERGKPGELRGVLTSKVKGFLSLNCECGVFGVLTSPDIYEEAIPIGRKNEIHEGAAEIISTVKNGERARYAIEICEIDSGSDSTKSFSIRVVDEALIAMTGGIVRGMSGSPIIQDGKLVGAVTHVMVANPTEGYGIFIENMLNAAQQGVQPKAA